MRPTFMGIQTALSAITLSQKGLDITANNVANSATTGYTRQRIDTVSTYIGGSRYRDGSSAYAYGGQGVSVTGIAQVRNQFLDSRYREVNTQSSEYSKLYDTYTEMADIFDDVELEGMTDTLQTMYTNINKLAQQADSEATAKIVMTSAKSTCQILRQFDAKLGELRSQQEYELSKIANERFNDITNAIATLNTQIADEMSYNNITQDPDTATRTINQSYGPNELLDSRNLLIDELSSYANIKVETQDDGSVNVYLKNTNDGADNLLALVKGDKSYELEETYDETTKMVTVNYLAGSGIPTDITNAISTQSEGNGAIGAYVNLINGKGVYANTTTATENESVSIAYFQKAIDNFANTFAKAFNDANTTGVETPGDLLFEGSGGVINAGNIALTSDFVNDPLGSLCTSVKNSDGTYQNTNLQKMITLFSSTTLEFGSLPVSGDAEFTGNFKTYLEYFTNELTQQITFYESRSDATDVIKNSILDSRDAVSAVNTEEEATNMITYSKSLNAASRVMTALDEALNTIINSMGLVGR